MFLYVPCIKFKHLQLSGLSTNSPHLPDAVRSMSTVEIPTEHLGSHQLGLSLFLNVPILVPLLGLVSLSAGMPSTLPSVYLGLC